MRGLCCLCVGLLVSFGYADKSTGPCGETLPCVPGQRFPDPTSCSNFYQCSKAGDGFQLQTCVPMKNFDYKHLYCRQSSQARCLLSCNLSLLHADTEKDVKSNGIGDKDGMLDDEVAVTDADSTEKEEEAAVTGSNSDQASTLGNDPAVTNGGAANVTAVDSTLTQGNDAVANGNETDETWITTGTENPDEGSGEEFVVPKFADVLRGEINATSETEVPTSEANQPLTSDDGTISTKDNEVETSEAETTTRATTTTSEPPLIVISDEMETVAPPYDIVTVEADVTTTANGTIGGDSGVMAAGMMIGLIAGAVAIIVLLIILIIVVIVVLRRRKYRKHHNIEKIENPQYSRPDRPGPRNLSFPRQSTLGVEPTVNFTQVNNNEAPRDNGEAASPEKKKRPAPSAPTPSQPPAGSSPHKRPAPSPPTLPHADLYEKDTPPGSSENIPLSTFAIRNPSASARSGSPRDPTEEPLLATKDRDSNGQLPGQETKKPLLAQAEDDGLSVDSYDVEKNPFYSD